MKKLQLFLFLFVAMGINAQVAGFRLRNVSVAKEEAKVENVVYDTEALKVINNRINSLTLRVDVLNSKAGILSAQENAELSDIPTELGELYLQRKELEENNPDISYYEEIRKQNMIRKKQEELAKVNSDQIIAERNNDENEFNRLKKKKSSI